MKIPIDDDDDIPLCPFCFHQMHEAHREIFECSTCQVEIYLYRWLNNELKWIRIGCMINGDKYVISLDYTNQQTGIHHYPCLQNLPEHKKLEYISGKINPSILWIKHLVKDVNPYNVIEKIQFLLTYS